MISPTPKRFWTQANVKRTETGFSVDLDTRPLRTPSKAALILPTEAMAAAVAQEWDALEDVIDPALLPVTRSANSAIDKVTPQRDAVVEMLAEYGDADLICYRAEDPERLVRQQAEAWDPALAWAEATFGARLAPRAGVMHAAQDPDALDRLASDLRQADSFALTALHDLVSLSGSLVLGLAAARDWKPAADIWDLSLIDEYWQEAQWGADEEAVAARQAKRDAFLHAKRFYDLGRTG